MTALGGTGGTPLLEALGSRATRLHPAVLEYVTEGAGEGRGVFEVAGSGVRWIWALARPFVGPGLLIAATEHDVPFSVVNRTGARGERSAVRGFEFSSGEQVLVDVLTTGRRPGELLNLLGERRRIELDVACSPDGLGGFRLDSRSMRLRVGRVRVRIPCLLGVRVEVTHGYDEAIGRHTIDTAARNPLLGVVLEYRGWFEYRTTP